MPGRESVCLAPGVSTKYNRPSGGVLETEDCDRYTKKFVLEEVFGVEVDE